MKLRVGICEDDAFTLSTLKAALSFEGVEVVFATQNPAEAISEFQRLKPHSVILDLHLGKGPTGIDLSRVLRASSPEVGLVFLTSFESPNLLNHSGMKLPSGSQYLQKREVGSVEHILSSLQASVSKARKSRFPLSGPVTQLTKHQLDVLSLVARGATNSEISRELFIDVKSVEAVIHRIANRLAISANSTKNQRIQMARAYLRATGSVDED